MLVTTGFCHTLCLEKCPPPYILNNSAKMNQF